ncbi:MAG: hypothetical protein L0J45_02935 [Psychroflexus sp.]|nr:hypothetical protein [Psychroflexus sp.]MDN6309331.1 hypothetical protein [Psychroflexus sp.]
MIKSLKPYAILSAKHLTITCLMFLCFTNAFSQKVEADIDTSQMRLGEQIEYRIFVEGVSKSDQIIFPKEQSFVPMEMVEALKIDTTFLKEDKLNLLKKYTLTQFDSGQYTIPPQLLKINDKPYLTDSLKLSVAGIEVDTTQQKLFPIKREIGVDKPFQLPTWLWWALGVLLFLVVLSIVYFKYRKKYDKSKRRIPPYPQAQLSLKELDQADYIKNRQFKDYITELTNISRRYLDEKIEVRAMEYTSNELIAALYQKKEDKQVNFKTKYLDSFQKILVQTDFSKFAGQNPDMISLKSYRKDIEKFIKHVQSAIPEPTAEEKRKDIAYQEQLRKKRKKQKIIAGVAIGILLFVFGVSSLIATKGYDYIRDNVFGNESKTMLENDWVTSEYSVPEIKITTPEVLVRQNLDSLGVKKMKAAKQETFATGSLYANLFVVLSQVAFEEEVDFDLEKAVDGVYENLEKKGAYNILMKNEDFETYQGVKGVKVSGSFAIENPITQNDIKKNYQILNFGFAGRYQQITIIYNAEDDYAETITERIINSVEFEKPDENVR